ncbi:MAG: DUF4296 domain-containing protein [Bacteroidaceae bacterium]|nr:DUF4296 domain-containing protein [Bacteroidaceae bacterium]
MRSKIGRTLLLGGFFLLMSCGKQIPSDIIQPAKMESVLYDYHLSMGIAHNSSADENYKKESYKNYIFKKHHITEAEFDSSMVWYTRNSQELAAIYQNLNKRFDREKNQITALMGDRYSTNTTSLPGDTVDLWQYYPVYWLTEAPLMNNLAFEFKADSNFWARDAFLWKANFTFLSPGTATMGLNVLYMNDSVVGQTKTITKSGLQSIYLFTDSAYKIKNVNGFIHVHGDTLNLHPSVLVNELSLQKYHRSETDSVASVTPQPLDEGEKPLKPSLKKSTRLTPQKKMQELPK